MSTRRFLTVALAVALAAVPTYLAAQMTGGPGAGMRGHGPGGPGLHMVQRMLHRLGDYLQLTDEQRAQIQGIVEEQMPAIHDQVRQLMEARRAYRATHDPFTFNEEDFRTFAQQQAQGEVAVKVATARMLSQALAVLTPEQRQKLEDLRKLFGPESGQGKALWHHGPGMRQGGPPAGS